MSYRFIEGENRWVIGTCDRCGIEWQFDQTYLKRSYSTEFCKDCRAKSVQSTGPSDDYCTPWQGEFDLDLFMPLDDEGKPYRPGIRLCGNADCVRPKHLISDDYARSVLRRVGLPIPSTLL